MLDLASLPDAHGHFGPYGGMFVPETLMTALNAHNSAIIEQIQKKLGA